MLPGNQGFAMDRSYASWRRRQVQDKPPSALSRFGKVVGKVATVGLIGTAAIGVGLFSLTRGLVRAVAGKLLPGNKPSASTSPPTSTVAGYDAAAAKQHDRKEMGSFMRMLMYSTELESSFTTRVLYLINLHPLVLEKLGPNVIPDQTSTVERHPGDADVEGLKILNSTELAVISASTGKRALVYAAGNSLSSEQQLVLKKHPHKDAEDQMQRMAARIALWKLTDVRMEIVETREEFTLVDETNTEESIIKNATSVPGYDNNNNDPLHSNNNNNAATASSTHEVILNAEEAVIIEDSQSSTNNNPNPNSKNDVIIDANFTVNRSKK